MKRTGLALERHRELGAQIHEIRNVFVLLTVELHHALGRREANRSERIARRIDDLRGLLDEAFRRDFPVMFDQNVYFPRAVLKLSAAYAAKELTRERGE